MEGQNLYLLGVQYILTELNLLLIPKKEKGDLRTLKLLWNAQEM